MDLYIVDFKQGNDLTVCIVEDFPNKVFSSLVIQIDAIKQLIEDIVVDDVFDYELILNNPVSLKFLNDDLTKVIIEPLNTTWDKFSAEIKTINRFHFVNAPDLDRLKTLFGYFIKEVPRGKKFYRARISTDKSGFKLNEMGNPPGDKVKGGRANPEGISYLYLSSDIKTTIYETRASLFDFVSIATFRLEHNIRIINLSSDTYDIFRLAELEQLEEVLLHSSFIQKLEEELSRPKRKSDSDLEYLPTQYLSELIKSMDIDGIEFRSSLYSDGYNLAIFNPEKFKVLDVTVYDVSRIDVEFEKV
ncbi:RES family NAD+ phosphorylase [Sphingobacterium sp. MYb382]|uniref:RES family NAD+ phosphorylase n=1 Tax=Sphingobacterium sp. MYb382 TaxID=2745278 RepID=UPI0030A8E1E7